MTTWRVSQAIVTDPDRGRTADTEHVVERGHVVDRQRLVDKQRADIMDWVRRDPELVTACSAAVDPLEVAAWLETRGLSRQVAADSFGYPDVFSAADLVYRTLPFETVEPAPGPPQQMGGPKDLLRGALYVLPTLFLTIAVKGFAFHPYWWVLPVGLTVAWAISQAAAVLGWALRGRGDEHSDSLLAFASIAISAAVSFGLASLARDVLGGNSASVLEAVGVATYIAAAGVLLFHASEWLLGICVLPAVVGSLAAAGFLPFGLSKRQGAEAVVASLFLVVAIAIGHVSRDHWRRPSMERADGGRAGKYFLYGLGCGLLISLFIGFSDEFRGRNTALLIAIWPLMLTLGLMEWQVRSFRGRAAGALTKSPDVADFARRARRSMLRSTAVFVTGLVLLSAAGVVIGHDVGAANVPLMLASIGAIGVAFFMALLVVASGQINQVLVCWGITFAVLGALLVATAAVRGRISPTAGIASLIVAGVTAVVILSVSAWRVLSSPIIY